MILNFENMRQIIIREGMKKNCKQILTPKLCETPSQTLGVWIFKLTQNLLIKANISLSDFPAFM